MWAIIVTDHLISYPFHATKLIKLASLVLFFIRTVKDMSLIKHLFLFNITSMCKIVIVKKSFLVVIVDVTVKSNFPTPTLGLIASYSINALTFSSFW